MSTVTTVLGPVPAEQLGKTIIHEHLFIDLSCYFRPPESAEEAKAFAQPVTLENLHFVHSDPYGSHDNCILDNVDLAVKEVNFFKELGGQTIVDVTLPDIGRDVRKLAEVARRTGVNILAGCGHYILSAQPEKTRRASAAELEDEMMSDIVDGIDGTGIKAGIIGEIGTGSPIDPQEEKVLRAAARVQRQTGLAITIHVHPPGRWGNTVLDILEDEGVAPDRIILDHVATSLAHLDIDFDKAMVYLKSLLARGCYVEFDLCGNSHYFRTSTDSWWMPTDRERCRALAQLVRDGYGHRLMLSQDVGHKHYLRSYGGWGYGHVLGDFSHHMREAGITDEQISKFFIDNPRDVLVAKKT
jgi:phosphotriesterase-related protein